MKIWRSSDENNFDCFFSETRCRSVRLRGYSQGFSRKGVPNDSGVLENGYAQTLPSKFPTATSDWWRCKDLTVYIIPCAWIDMCCNTQG